MKVDNLNINIKVKSFYVLKAIDDNTWALFLFIYLVFMLPISTYDPSTVFNSHA